MHFLTIPLLALSVCGHSDSSAVSSNYDGLKDLVQGLMSGFYSTEYQLPSDCMSATFQSKLDQDFVAWAKELITGHLADVVEYFGILRDDLGILAQECNVTAVEAVIVQQYAKEGPWSLAFTVFLNLLEIVPRLSECLAELLVGNGLSAGRDLGLVLRRVFPPS